MRLPALQVILGMDDIHNRLSACKVDFAVQERTHRILPRIGRHGARLNEGAQDPGQIDASAVRINLDRILPREGRRVLKQTEQDIIKRLARKRVEKRPMMHISNTEFSSVKAFFDDPESLRPRNTQHANCGGALARRNGSNRQIFPRALIQHSTLILHR